MGEHGQVKEDGGQLAGDHDWAEHIARHSILARVAPRSPRLGRQKVSAIDIDRCVRVAYG